MAFCVYPLALAIRATNVYEERALGIPHDDEPSLKTGLYNLRREKGYSKFHLREQLAVSRTVLIRFPPSLRVVPCLSS